jgi:superfamily II DNA or RNA helicase
MSQLRSIHDYLELFSDELGSRILDVYPALHGLRDPLSPRIETLLRMPRPAQAIVIMGVAKRWESAKSAAIIGECGTGKTLISLGAIHVHSRGRPYAALAMVPPHLVEKWAREAILTIPGIRVFFIDDIRNGGDHHAPHGVNEVRLRNGRILREALQTSLTDLRLRKNHASSRKRWASLCSSPSLFIVGRERAKLGYFWDHCYNIPKSGNNRYCVVNPDTGEPIATSDGRLAVLDFKDSKLSEIITSCGSRPSRSRYSALWQADRDKIVRESPVDFISRYLRDWFDYFIADEAHQLANDTAQGNALGTLGACIDRVVALTGTLMGGYAGNLFNILYRLEPGTMKEEGFEWGASGRSDFVQGFGVLETITTIRPEHNDCSDSKTASVVVRERPGASPLLFGKFLMSLCSFVFLEDMADELPPYEEFCVPIPMDPALAEAYADLEEQMQDALRENKRNRSVLSTMLNALLLYPDRPFSLGTLWGTRYDPDEERKVRFEIATPQDLPENFLYAKERQLIETIKKELAEGRKCQVFAVYTRKHDVTARLEAILQREGIRTAILRANVPTEKREAWYAKRSTEGVSVVIAHPKLVETGLDLLEFPTIIFYETGYSLHTLRQASRRSWRIGQHHPVRIFFFVYDGTAQTTCIKLMGKKLLVALTMEGKFAGAGLHSMEEDEDDILSQMARELVQKRGIGETADAVWRQVRTQHEKLFARQEREAATTAIADATELEPIVVDADASNPVVETSVFVFGQQLPTRKRSRRKPVASEQILFNWN